MPFGCVRGTMWFFHRIEVAAGGRCVRGRAVSKFMNVECMFSGGKPGDVGDHLNGIAGFGEGDGARYLASGRGVQDGDRFSSFLGERIPESECHRDRSQREDVEWLEGFAFHESKICLQSTECKLRRCCELPRPE